MKHFVDCCGLGHLIADVARSVLTVECRCEYDDWLKRYDVAVYSRLNLF